MNEVNKILIEIEARASAATKGPWKSDWPHGLIHPPYAACGEDHEPIVHTDGVSRKSDQEFIAHARQDIPLLIALLRKAVEQRDDLLSGLVHSSQDHIDEWRENANKELAELATRNGEEK
jgi:hypothetical protein